MTRKPAIWTRVPGAIGIGLAVMIGCLVRLPLSAEGSPEIVPGTDQEATALVVDLASRFEVIRSVSDAPEGDAKPVVVTRFRFNSTMPYKETVLHSQIFPWAELMTFEHPDAHAAESAFEDLWAGGTLDTGLPYALGYALVNGTFVYRMHATCLFSQESFQQVTSRLEQAIRRQKSADNLRVAACRCGADCREVLPDS